MNKHKLSSLFFTLIFSISASAFSTDAERIDSYLVTYKSASIDNKVTMLERLQWSGISSPRLYDPMEKLLLENAGSKSTEIVGDKRKLMAHSIRALGFSGNVKYHETIMLYERDAASGNLRRYARKALVDLDKFQSWNKLIEASNVNTEDKPVEVAIYMKMMSSNDVFLQRQAARAIFHEKQTDTDLIALTAEKLKAAYLNTGIDKPAQDTAAWLCKAIGQSGIEEYADLLRDAVANSPHRKIQKYAKKYAI